MEKCRVYKEVCTVRQMAVKVGLSPSRFYEYIAMNIFPEPLKLHCGQKDRSFYPLYLQEICLEVRRTGIGINGQMALFYRPRKKPVDGGRGTSRSQSSGLYDRIAEDLNSMGRNVTATQVRAVIRNEFPQGLKQKDVNGETIKKLYNYFRNRV
jgi:hypothetical protein